MNEPVIKPADAGCKALAEWGPTEFRGAGTVGGKRLAKYRRGACNNAFVVGGVRFVEDADPGYEDLAEDWWPAVHEH